MMPEPFDLIVIGAGPGGYVAAIRAAQLGKRVVCIDKRAALGGTCLNIGCIPSKALLDASEMYVLAQSQLARFGVKVKGVSLDLAAMQQRKDKIVHGLANGIAHLFKKNRVAFVQGSARIARPGHVAVKQADEQSMELEAPAILLATGSEPASLPAVPFDSTSIVSSTEALCFDRVPAHLVVIGGGYIGVELGSAWARLGARVTVLEFLPRILPGIDAEIAGLVQKSLTRQGLTFHLETRVTAASSGGGQVIVRGQGRGQPAEWQADRVLVAVGRKPLTAGLGLDEVGVAFDERTGRIRVNDAFETSVAGVFAIGDLIDGPMLAHKAHEDGIAFAEKAGRPCSACQL
jgi:dihydrolipoamide dehydrogenase